MKCMLTAFNHIRVQSNTFYILISSTCYTAVYVLPYTYVSYFSSRCVHPGWCNRIFWLMNYLHHTVTQVNYFNFFVPIVFTIEDYVWVVYHSTTNKQMVCFKATRLCVKIHWMIYTPNLSWHWGTCPHWYVEIRLIIHTSFITYDWWDLGIHYFLCSQIIYCMSLLRLRTSDISVNQFKLASGHTFFGFWMLSPWWYFMAFQLFLSTK